MLLLWAPVNDCTQTADRSTFDPYIACNRLMLAMHCSGVPMNALPRPVLDRPLRKGYGRGQVGTAVRTTPMRAGGKAVRGEAMVANVAMSALAMAVRSTP